MRAVIQRVSHAEVVVDQQTVGAIQHGLLILLGIENGDESSDADYLVQKITQMRIFNDEQGKMNRSVIDTSGECLVVSQFTLHADTRKGNRPSFLLAARPEQAIPLYEYFIQQMNQILSKPCATGIFGADMKVTLLNDGPVTIIIDSKQK
jgi:D-tyrosyl-tRNA(Tyr) deacylase